MDYVVPNIPTLEELQQQHQAEQQEPLQGREEWAVKTSISQVGEWQTVEKPIPKPVKPKVEEKKESSSHDQKPEFQDDEDKEEKDKLRGFKLKEKEYPDDALFDEKGEDKGDEKVVFKKRSLDSSNALKSRKKTFRKKGN